jgi:hypothetical protein
VTGAESAQNLSATIRNWSLAIIVVMISICAYLSHQLDSSRRMPNKQPSWNQVHEALQDGRYEKAIGVAKVLVDRQSEDFAAHSYMTTLYLMVNDLPNAEKEAQLTYNLFPTEEYRQQLLAVQQLRRQAATNSMSVTTPRR